MKKITFTTLFLLSSIFIFSQQNENVIERSIDETSHDIPPKPSLHFTSREVDKMVILKECTSADSNNKIELQKCIAGELMNRISQRFSEFDKIADSLQINEATAKIKFVFDKNRKLDKIQSMTGGNPNLAKFVKSVFDEIKETIEFEPAQIKGEKVDLVFQLPVKYVRVRE